jgi:hypothetical protein
VIALGLLAAVSKEQGFVTPALLLVTAGIAGQPPGAVSVRRMAPAAVGLASLLLALLVLRAAVLGGLAGQAPVAPLQGLTPTTRVLVSLGTVPDWARLLLWPARLSFDYSPPGYQVAATPGTAHLLAGLILGVCLWLAWRNRRSAPAITLGLTWTAIALLPVSNLMLPTGVLLAERTLWPASVRYWRLAASRSGYGTASLWLRPATSLIATGFCCWREQQERNAPPWLTTTPCSAGRGWAPTTIVRIARWRFLDRQGQLEAAERSTGARSLWGRDPGMYEDLAILLHRQERDAEAVGVLTTGLDVAPSAPVMRSKLYYIQAAHGEWQEARATAAAGLALGDTMFAPLVRLADSALASATPRGS